jgi:hypothetical protein
LAFFADGDSYTGTRLKCGSEYRPEQEHEGETWTFAGDSVDMFVRVSDEDLIEELHCRGYTG